MNNEQALLQRAQQYDEQAIADLYDHYAPLIYAYLYRRVQDAGLAEDLTSEVFLRALESIRAERLWHTSFRAWLYRVAHNLVVDHYRHRPAIEPAPLEDDMVWGETTPETGHLEYVRQAQLRAALAQLTQEQQQVLSLRFGEQLHTKEIARIVGKTVGAVEALQHRALQALKRWLGDEYDEEHTR